MCLKCNPEIGVHDRDLIISILNDSKSVYLCTIDNKRIKLIYDQIKEIAEHALVVIMTHANFDAFIWAIQWPCDYSVKTIK